MIEVCIQHGFILIYSTHSEPVILHEQGVLVPKKGNGTLSGGKIPDLSSGKTDEKEVGGHVHFGQPITALPVPAFSVKEIPHIAVHSLPSTGWQQGERWATGIFLYVLLPISIGMIGYLLTQSRFMGWVSGVLCSVLLLSGRQIGKRMSGRRGHQSISSQENVQKAA